MRGVLTVFEVVLPVGYGVQVLNRADQSELLADRVRLHRW